jgi:hypothetical protein
MSRRPGPSFVVGALFCSVLVVGCSEVPDTEPVRSGGSGIRDTTETFTRRVFERNFVFASTEGDSAFIVPWMTKTTEESDSVLREARGWLERGGGWDEFYAERWSTPPSRSAARLVPHAGLEFLVRDGDVLDGILFERGARTLELILGDVRASWTGPRGGTYTVLTGAAFLVDQRVDGMVLDMSRGTGGPGEPGGDWVFLLSGDSAAFVFAGDVEYGGEAEPFYRGWGATPEQDFQWGEVHLDWERTEAFPPARRDIPVEWRITSADGLLDGQVQAVSADLQPGEGPGPLLPVRALFEVSGTLSTRGGDFAVHGLLVHERR